ncbi:hypothetical protein [Halobacillus sp. KGW1]|uniref:hypothetical protein n=1 Tax=Halobacillus sp. KGW1 TaxID=1793726 RepID=UPI000783E4AB|nr:hypothetical protein [Halobacillus sp. KGW1]
MKEETAGKVRRILMRAVLLLVALGISYIFAYTFHYAPQGYEVVEKNEAEVLLQKNNSIGVEEEQLTFAPNDEQEWKVDYLLDLVNRQQSQYWIFFTTILTTLFFVGADVRKGEPLRKVLFFSGFYVLFSALALVQNWNTIKDIVG